jgi:hypothetical protein
MPLRNAKAAEEKEVGEIALFGLIAIFIHLFCFYLL